MLFKIIVDPNWNHRLPNRVKTNKNITTWLKNRNSHFLFRQLLTNPIEPIFIKLYLEAGIHGPDRNFRIRKSKSRAGPGPTKNWNLGPDRSRTSKKFPNLGPDRTRINKILKISDQFGPGGPWIPALKVFVNVPKSPRKKFLSRNKLDDATITRKTQLLKWNFI